MDVTNLRARCETLKSLVIQASLAAIALACSSTAALAVDYGSIADSSVLQYDNGGYVDAVPGGIVSDGLIPGGTADGVVTEGPMDGELWSSGQPGMVDTSSLPPDGTLIECPTCPPGGQGCKDCCKPPYGLFNRLIDNKHACWTFRTDGILLWRNSPRTQPLYDYFPPAKGTALDAHQINSTPAGGPRFSIFRTDGCGDALEATYFRAANFRGISTLPFRQEGYQPAYLPIPSGVDTATANLGSSLQSFELNGRMTVCKTIQLLGGFRWFEWRESLQMNDSSSVAVPPFQESVSVNCINSLYGYQIGFDSLLFNSHWLRVEGLMKGGAYLNNALQTTVANTSISPTTYQSRVGTPHTPAFVGELGLTGVVPITCNCDFRFGYMGLWLESLAQPTNQKQTLDPAVPATLNLTGGVVLQGITLGLEGRW